MKMYRKSTSLLDFVIWSLDFVIWVLDFVISYTFGTSSGPYHLKDLL